MVKTWKKEELTYLKRYAKTKLLAELAERFDATTDEVSEKLEELGLAAQDTLTRQKIEHDPLVKVLEKGVRALHRHRWDEAATAFEEVVETSDRAPLRARARQYLAICTARQDGDGSQGAEDPYLEAVYERNRGNLETALEICTRGGRQGKDDRFAYLAAAIHALTGDHESSARLLTKSIELNPKNRIHAHHDTDFVDLLGDPEYAELLEEG